MDSSRKSAVEPHPKDAFDDLHCQIGSARTLPAAGRPRAWQTRGAAATLRASRDFRRGILEGRMATHRRIGVTKVGDVSVVKFQDKKIVDETSTQELGAELFGLVEQDNRKSILLDFSGVEFLSSAALGKLITLDRKVKSHKGRLKLCGIRPEILEVFQITKLNKVFDIRADEAEAVAAFA
jgi:anti-sigma B factor antagonist